MTDEEMAHVYGIAAPTKGRPMQYIVKTEHRFGMLDFISPGDVIEVL